MNNSTVFVIGLMSGTSLDGIDLVYVRFDKNKYQDFEILASETVSYSEEWKTTLQDAINFSSDALRGLNLTYGKLLGEVLNSFIDKFHIKDIDFIASHGHTVLHQPKKGITLQVGDGQVIANSTAQKVICDFRTQDVKLGGQGAPLVPIGEELLFSNYDYCLNLGGFSNISFDYKGERLAFDICPVNIVLNIWAEKLDVPFDNKGLLAESGTVDKELLAELNNLNFYKNPLPKSLAWEWVQEFILPLLEKRKRSEIVVLRTFTEHVAVQLVAVFSQYKLKHILVSGGGVFNEFLLTRVNALSNSVLLKTDPKIIESKEAMAFAFLGLMKMKNKINILASVTGSVKDHCSGKIYTE